MEIRSLKNVPYGAIFRAFERAFADYELQLDQAQLLSMLRRRGFNPELSFAAFEGDNIVAFTLNGTGNFEGIPTAYDTGTGTLPAYRGKGLATRIFEHSLPYLKKANIRQYLLEVLQHNEKAISVYRKLGFGVTREFNYFSQANGEVKNEFTTKEAYSISQIDTSDIISLPGFRDFHPSWQNSFESIERSAGGFVTLGAFGNEGLLGYCVFEPISGDVTQIAVHNEHRRQGIGSLLLREMTSLNKNGNIKVVNTDISCLPVTRFLEAKNITLRGKQFEMTRKI